MIEEYVPHRQVRARHPSGRRIRVDAGIAPLLRAMWKRGIETSLSCEDSDGSVWICFPDAGYAETFFNRALNLHDLVDVMPFHWHWGTQPFFVEKLESVVFTISVSFPVEHYEIVLERMR